MSFWVLLPIKIYLIYKMKNKLTKKKKNLYEKSKQKRKIVCQICIHTIKTNKKQSLLTFWTLWHHINITTKFYIKQHRQSKTIFFWQLKHHKEFTHIHSLTITSKIYYLQKKLNFSLQTKRVFFTTIVSNTNLSAIHHLTIIITITLSYSNKKHVWCCRHTLHQHTSSSSLSSRRKWVMWSC